MNIKTYKLPDSLSADLRRMREEVDKFKKKDTSAAEFRSFRVPQGVYEERTEGNFMLRVRLPAGALLPQQMRTLADVSAGHGSGILHVTTRQDIQVHSVGIDALCDALETLADSGLSTRGSGGNGVRNITSCHDAGVCTEEVFDVRPYAVALTEKLLDNPDNFKLPRKYKIAFAGCPADCGGAIVNDLGFIAKIRDKTRGFTVYAGGGLGARSATGTLLEEFIPTGDCCKVAEAVKRVFDAHGNRRNKHRARLRFLIKQMGFERFKELYRAELENLRDGADFELRPKEMPGSEKETAKITPTDEAGEDTGDEYHSWLERNVVSQKQTGRNIVSVPLTLGDIDAESFRRLADTLEKHPAASLQTTQWQNLRMHSVPDDALPELYDELRGPGLGGSAPVVIQNATACTGAQTCKLGICLSRGLTEAITEKLGELDGKLDHIEDLKISVSGCPNSCGRHPIAHIGFFGGARRVDQRLTPHYTIQLGGRLGEGRTRLAKTIDVLHARNIPDFLSDFLESFITSSAFPDFNAFLENGGRETAADIASRHKEVPSFKEDRNYYYDYGAEDPFSLAGRGPGECGAGVFDLIEVDLQSAGEAFEADDLPKAVVLAARSLLITRGEEASSDIDALELFSKHFIKTGLVTGEAENVARCALEAIREKNEQPDLNRNGVRKLIDRVRHLYDSMDQSLKFSETPTEAETDTQEEQVEESGPGSAEKSGIEADKEADFRGVACPLNYVKTKMALGPMKSGQVLSVLVDEEGCENVPDSVKKDGHEVLDINQIDQHYKIYIKKE